LRRNFVKKTTCPGTFCTGAYLFSSADVSRPKPGGSLDLYIHVHLLRIPGFAASPAGIPEGSINIKLK
jgi:hypothetical protein